MSRKIVVTLLTLALLGLCLAPAAVAKKDFRVGVSIYAGWMPWYYLMETGLMDEVAEAHGVTVEIVPFGDYINSINAYVSGDVDACVMTNMECLDMPAASGIPSVALITGDYSNGNDALLVRGGLSLQDLKGKDIYLVELSVSHYLLARALEMQTDFNEYDLSIINTSDQTIGASFISNDDWPAVVTWNPIVMQVAQTPGVTKLFDSSQIPGEILDLCVVNKKALDENKAFGEALVDAWFKVMGIMVKRGSTRNEALSTMASLAGCEKTVEYTKQLETTFMFYNAQDAVSYVESQELKDDMDRVRRFCFDHGLLGENARSADEVGIMYPDGSVMGDKDNVQMWFDTSYVKRFIDGK